MFKTRYGILAILLLSALWSCGRESLGDSSGDCVIDYGFTINGTRSGSASSTTYRAMLHRTGGNPGEYPYLNNSGTYRGPAIDERAWLTACTVNSTTGEWTGDSHTGGLRANRGSYYLSFVSPAVAPQQYKWNSTTNKYDEWGFLMHRELAAGEPELFISSPKLINSLKGNHLENSYVYDVPDDVILTEYRAKVTLKLKCGDDLLSATVKKVGWSNLYTSCYYNLRLDTLDTFTLAPATDTVFVYTPGTELTMTRGADPVTVCSDFFLFPLYYAQKDSHDEYVFEAPELDVYVAQGVAKLKVFHNMEPQHTYTYTVTINSAYVSVDVTSAPWDDAFTGSTDVNETPSYSTSFTYLGWDSHNASGTID